MTPRQLTYAVYDRTVRPVLRTFWYVALQSGWSGAILPRSAYRRRVQ
jgi:hypothetical protein